jgi:microcystin-dependent protein
MPWTDIPDKSTGDLMDETWYDDHFKGNMEWLKNSLVPTGTIFMWSTDTAPTGWVLCNGAAISRNDYSDLFGVIGTTFGNGDGSTTFNVPDLRGRMPLGQDDMGGTSANRVTDANADSMGGSGGAEDVTLTEAQLASHNHTVSLSDAASTTQKINASRGQTLSYTIISGTSGSDQAHNNMPPYLTLNFIIKT